MCTVGYSKNYDFIYMIVIMELCKAPTLRHKVLNKHTYIMYIEMENVTPFFFF